MVTRVEFASSASGANYPERGATALPYGDTQQWYVCFYRLGSKARSDVKFETREEAEAAAEAWVEGK